MTTETSGADGAHGHGSLYGQGFLEFMDDIEAHRGPAWRTAEHVMTHGGRLPLAMALPGLGPVDGAVYEVLKEQPQLLASPGPADPAAGPWLDMAVNAMGRLHLRPSGSPRVATHAEDRWQDVAVVTITPPIERRIGERLAQWRAREDAAQQRLHDALVRRETVGELATILEQVIDHVEHVESVCFYCDDRFYALIDRFTNLIDTKAGAGFLPRLRGRPLVQWTAQERLIVAALHALFVSGKAVRFEEFNGCTLTAQRLLERLEELHAAYRSCGCEARVDAATADVFELAAEVRAMATSFTGRPQLRYRWIYALTFQKNERLLGTTRSGESAGAHTDEFAEFYAELLAGRPDPVLPQSLLFTQLASACLARDLQGVPFAAEGSAATGWIESLIERIVASALRATGSDYAMSSSLRELTRLLVHDPAGLAEAILALTPADFYTCFVSREFGTRLDAAAAQAIAASVQKRMMFNRWHFIPGNLERERVPRTRHWYYPPLVPDLAVHSDVHRAAHSRAGVRFSIRAPGPDVSRPALRIAGHTYRGFYDIRTVRMDGSPYGTEDMLRARRRTLWLEAVFGVLVSYLEEGPASGIGIRGFAPGRWLDLPAQPAPRRQGEPALRAAIA